MSSEDAGSGGWEGAPRAAAVLCGLYHEAAQRLRHLQEQLSARDALVERLRARLAALEGDTAPSLVDALLEQVARCREQLRQREGGAAEAALRQEIERLSEQLEEKERETERLRGQRGPEQGPERGPERGVALLWGRGAEDTRAQAASAVLWRSLADETQRLRRTLAATAHMCQHLAKCLDARQHARGDAGERSPEPACPGRDAAAQEAVEKLREENRRLKQEVARVEDLNARWQRYDASRDERVRGLRAQLRALQGPAGPEPLGSEVRRLREQLAAARAARDAALERAQVLEQQVLVYKDDFASERADRERAQSRAQELERRLAARGQDSREPGSCRIHTGTKTPKCLETDAVGLSAPGGQWPETPAEGAHPGPARGGQGDLQCPHCLRDFGDEQGEELFRHVAECCQ